MVKLSDPHMEGIQALIEDINLFHYLHLEKRHQIETVRAVQMGNLLSNLKSQTKDGWVAQVLSQLNPSKTYINQYIKIATKEETALKELKKKYSSLYPMYLDLKRILNRPIKVVPKAVPKAVLIPEPTLLVKMLQGDKEVGDLLIRINALSAAQDTLAQEKKTLQKQICAIRANLLT